MPGVQGRNVIVTGASKGIGLATARLLTSCGAKVMAVARTEKDLISSGLVNFVAADVSTQEGCAMVVEKTLQVLGVDGDGPRIDILVCNHGIGSAHEKPLHEHSIEDYHQSIQTNLNGPLYLTRLVMPIMVKNNYGRIVYTSSTAATVSEPAAVGYNTSKAGLCGLMRSVCEDGGIYNITSNAVLPGWVRTEMAERHARAEAAQRGITKEQVWEERAALYPAKRVATPEEVAQTILFLSSEESSGVSGESIRVSLGCPY